MIVEILNWIIGILAFGYGGYVIWVLAFGEDHDQEDGRYR